jgi:hypothetical protein
MEKYKLGRVVNHDNRSLSFGFDTRGLSIIDVEHKRLIPVLNQGQVGSCTGNAGIGAVNTEPFIQHPTPHYSPDENGALKLYADAEIIDGGIGYPPEDKGSSGLSVAKALYNAGMISGYQHIFTLEDTLKALSIYTVISGMNWFSNMFTPDADGRVHPIGTIEGGHEVEAYKVDTKLGRIWFYNSWGNWGIGGTFYLTWADFADLLSQQGDATVLFPIVETPPTPVYKTLKLGSTGDLVITLQTLLNKIMGCNLVTDGHFGPKTKAEVILFQVKNHLTPDGVVGPKTWDMLNGKPNTIKDIITQVCIANNIEPEVLIAVATAESSLNPNAKLYNPGSSSTDRGLLQWNSKYHAEISDADAYDPTKAIEWGCKYLNQNPANLHGFWSASQKNWAPMLSPASKAKYGII